MRVISATKHYITRNAALSVVTISVMTLTFFITSLFVVTALASQTLLNFFEAKAQVIAFFKDTATESEVLGIKTSLEATGKVAEIDYTSKEQALKIYTGKFQEEPALLESISSNILPASLDIRTKDIKFLPDIATFLEKEPLVEDVRFYRDIVERLRTLTKGIRLAGTSLIVILTIISVFITLTTIGMTIHTRGEEIEIMKLVGATDWHVRWPFILQGAFYGFVSALLSSGALLLILPRIVPFFTNTLLGSVSLSLIDNQFLYILVATQIASGAFLGSSGSFIAVWRYLK